MSWRCPHCGEYVASGESHSCQFVNKPITDISRDLDLVNRNERKEIDSTKRNTELHADRDQWKLRAEKTAEKLADCETQLMLSRSQRDIHIDRARQAEATAYTYRKALENIIEHQEFEKLFHKEVTEKMASSNRIGHLTWGDMREAFKIGLVVGKQQAETGDDFEDNYPNDYDEVTDDGKTG